MSEGILWLLSDPDHALRVGIGSTKRDNSDSLLLGLCDWGSTLLPWLLATDREREKEKDWWERERERGVSVGERWEPTSSDRRMGSSVDANIESAFVRLLIL